MPKMTITEKLVAGLLQLGFDETKPTTYYRVFVPTERSAVRFKTTATKVYVGSAGALRGSREGKVTTSFAYNDTAKQRVIEAGFEMI